MKSLKVAGLVVMGVVGLLGMSASVKADVQKLDEQQMQQVKGGSTSDTKAQAKVKPLTKQEMQSAKGASPLGKACNELHTAIAGECTKMPNGNSYKWIPVDTCGLLHLWKRLYLAKVYGLNVGI